MVARSLSRNMGYINELFVLLLEVGYLADALWVCGVWGSQRGQWQGRRGTRQGRRATLAQQDGHWGFSLWVTLMNFFVLVVCKWVPQGQSRLSPWPPRFPRPLGYPCRWFRFGAFLATFVLACWGIPAPKGQNNGFPRPGRHQRSIGPERCSPGPPNEHFGWPHRWFGRAQHLS